jgi:tRNA-splicing ligase RtcB
MQYQQLTRLSESTWRLEPRESMAVPVILYADEPLLIEMDEKVLEQASRVAMLPGVAEAVYVLPDAHWGHGFPIGGVAGFHADHGVVAPAGVGFDIGCGVRCLTTGLPAEAIEPIREQLADALFERIPAKLRGRGAVTLDDDETTQMLLGGARWAVTRGWGSHTDLARSEEHGCMAGAKPEHVSARARRRQRNELGTLGSGNHDLELQRVAELFEPTLARALGLEAGTLVVSLHCGSRGLGQQINTDYLRQMVELAEAHGLALPGRELACAPVQSACGRAYVGAMRAAVNCAMANRQIITHLLRGVFSDLLPSARLELVYDVSHNTCKEERHFVDGTWQTLLVHRKGATRALGPEHPGLPLALRRFGQPVFVGGSMGSESWVLAGVRDSAGLSLSSACHGAGRRLSRSAAARRFRGEQVVDALAQRHITLRSSTRRWIAEEAPGAYKDVRAVVEVAERAGLARKVARLEPMIVIKGC